MALEIRRATEPELPLARHWPQDGPPRFESGLRLSTSSPAPTGGPDASDVSPVSARTCCVSSVIGVTVRLAPPSRYMSERLDRPPVTRGALSGILGHHQFPRPSNFIVEGTSTSLTTVA